MAYKIERRKRNSNILIWMLNNTLIFQGNSPILADKERVTIAIHWFSNYCISNSGLANYQVYNLPLYTERNKRKKLMA